jgi:excisionase family DNA binding protein
MAAPASLESMIAEAVAARLQPQLDALRAEVAQLRGCAPELVPLPEAARRLGVDLRTVQRWAKDGSIEVEQVGGVRLIRLPAGVRAT